MMNNGIKIHKKEKGITLIALVITIIVLLILAGVSIAMLTGDNGILTQATAAKKENIRGKEKEQIKLAMQSLRIQKEKDNLSLIVTSEELQKQLEYDGAKDVTVEAGENEKLIVNYQESKNSYIVDQKGNIEENGTNEGTTGENGYNKEKNVNSPKVAKGMIPIKYNGTDWVVCSEEDPEWYNYDNTKKWANVMLSDGKYKEGTVQEGQVVKENELGSMYVWIPRYAYRIAGEKNIEVNFLKGTTNKDKNDKEYTTDQNVDTKTTAIVHPAFNLGGKELSGIWVSKFEASGTNKDGEAVGNASSSSQNEQYAPDETTIAKSLPNKISWRHITIGESQKRSMDIAGSQKEKYGLENANSHLIKNSEWGAVAYLCYSQYGNVPKANRAGTYASGGYWYDLYTGQGPKNITDEGYYTKIDNTHNYDTENGRLASTTGNVTGIYDMNGGSWELIAGYLDNENQALNDYGKTSEGNIKYFENGKLNETYANLWDKYDVSEEEKTNKIAISDGTALTQNELWDTNKKEEKYQEARRKITEDIYNNMRKHKGIGINEVSTEFSFYSPYGTSPIWGWFITAKQAIEGINTFAEAWDSDYMLIGHSGGPFIARGGDLSYEQGTGVLASDIADGNTAFTDTFRAVIIVKD